MYAQCKNMSNVFVAVGCSFEMSDEKQDNLAPNHYCYVSFSLLSVSRVLGWVFGVFRGRTIPRERNKRDCLFRTRAIVLGNNNKWMFASSFSLATPLA